MDINIIAVLRYSSVMMALLFLSIMSFAFILERWWYMRRTSVNTQRFIMKIKTLIANNAYADAIKLSEKNDKALLNVIKVGLTNRNKSKEDVEELMLGARMEERIKLERFLPIIGTIGAIAPLLGLFGTVLGLVRAFRDLALAGSAGPSVVAAGISEALYTTVGGLGIAIPTVMFYNYFMGRVRKINTELEVSSKKLLVMLYSHEK